MKNLILSKPLVTVMAALLMSSCVAMGYMRNDDVKHNEISVGVNTSEIIGDFEEKMSLSPGESCRNRIAVINTGEVDCYVRVFAEVEEPDVRERVSFDVNEEDWSRKKEDGYRYYGQILHPGETTSAVFTQMFTDVGVDEFKMICYSESVQSLGFSSAEEAFASIE